MKKLIVILMLIFICSVASAEESLRYNGVEGRYEYAGEKDVLKYNGVEERYEYVTPDPPTPKKQIIKEPVEKPVRYSRDIPCLGCKPGEPTQFQSTQPRPNYRTWGDEE